MITSILTKLAAFWRGYIALVKDPSGKDDGCDWGDLKLWEHYPNEWPNKD